MTKEERYEQILAALIGTGMTATQIAKATGQNRIVTSRYLADLLALGRVRTIPTEYGNHATQYVIRKTPGPKPRPTRDAQ